MAKQNAKTGNPFLDADFDQVMDFGKLAEQFKFPGVDSNALMETQRRNLEAVTKANQVAFDGVQAVAQRQAEILRQAMDEATKAVQTLSKTDKIEDVWVKQTELVKEAYELALANLRELTELGTKTNTEAADVLSHRVADSLDEIKGALSAKKGAQ